MLKTLYILIFYLLSSLAFAQKDTSNVRWPNMNHFVGVSVGYSGYDKVAGYNGEFNLNYVFNPQYFMVKTEFGLAPSTNFGNLKKGFVSIGFSTKSNKLVSWHMLTGLGMISPSKSPAKIFYDNSYRTFTFYSKTFYLETGLYFRPMKQRKWIFGLNAQLYKASIADHTLNYIGSLENAFIPNINFSINYKLNR